MKYCVLDALNKKNSVPNGLKFLQLRSTTLKNPGMKGEFRKKRTKPKQRNGRSCIINTKRLLPIK